MPDKTLLSLVDQFVNGAPPNGLDCERLSRSSTAAIGDRVLADKLCIELHELLTRALATNNAKHLLPRFFDLAGRVEAAIQETRRGSRSG